MLKALTKLISPVFQGDYLSSAEFVHPSFVHFSELCHLSLVVFLSSPTLSPFPE